MTDTRYDYAGSGNFPGLPSKISQAGTDVTLKYNEIGQPIELRIPSVGIHQEWSYTSDYFFRNFRTHIRDFEGYEYETRYNDFGQVTETETPTGIKSYIDYDPDTGLPETIRDHLQNTVRFDYDDIGRRDEIEDPEGNITTITYYENDLTESITDPEFSIASTNLQIWNMTKIPIYSPHKPLGIAHVLTHGSKAAYWMSIPIQMATNFNIATTIMTNWSPTVSCVIIMIRIVSDLNTP